MAKEAQFMNQVFNVYGNPGTDTSFPRTRSSYKAEIMYVSHN